METNPTYSFCITCKGRLWQLNKTLPVNILDITEDSEIILLDYHSNDGLEAYIKDEYQEYLLDGRLKYYKMTTAIKGFDMGYAKHIAHILARGSYLFNLDADNFIGTAKEELSKLKGNEFLVCAKTQETSSSKGGRVGLSRNLYFQAGGYSCRLLGMVGDDGEFITRLLKLNAKPVYSRDETIPIQQPDPYKELNQVKRRKGFKLPSSIKLKDFSNNTVELNLRIPNSIF